ncbi:MAG TPA: site-2 protease family protein [Gaiellaceae bacterium]|nr:site-2 protease family protein [Gaiellaceae bacterium]
MSASITLGRIAGIRIGINWSWLVVFALLTWSWATAIFPDQNPGLSDSTYWAMAFGSALLFFASILLHELGHAFQARREGMEIDGITLWLFGGVAQFKGMFPSAGAEFRIAIAGPLVSLVLGIAFVAIALAVHGAPVVDGTAAWLGYINLTVLVFNLLPALPLDGGRVLRSALWAAKGDFASATRIAASIGRGFGFLFIAGGVALFFMNDLSGLWLAFIGWFLLGAASAEARYIAVRDALGGLRVRDLMVRDPQTVAPSMSIGDLMDRVVWTHRYTTYPVVENGQAVGLLPFRCVAQVPRGEWDERTVRDCMLPADDVPTLTEDEPLEDALIELSNGVGRGLVLDGQRLVGLLSMSDLARALETRGLRRRGGT